MLQMDDFSCRLRMGSPLAGGGTVGVTPLGVSLQLGSSGASAFHAAASSSPPGSGCSSYGRQHHPSGRLPTGGLPTILIAAPNADPIRLKAQAVQHASAFFAVAAAASANTQSSDMQGDPSSSTVGDTRHCAPFTLTIGTGELPHTPLVSDPALREEVSAVQLELQRQILALQQEQHLQQQILLQHFHLRQRHLQQQHDQQLADRIRLYMENQRHRSDNSSHSDEDRDSGNGSDKDIGTSKNNQELGDKESPHTGQPSPPIMKCPKKDVLRKLEEEEKLRLATRSSTASTPPVAQSPPAPNRSPGLSSSPKKSSTNGASAEVRLKLQQFLARRQEQRGNSWHQTDGAPQGNRGSSYVSQRDRQASSSSEGSTTSSHSGSESESPPITTPNEDPAPLRKNASAPNDLTLKVKSALRQKVMEGRTSPITKNEKTKNKPQILEPRGENQTGHLEKRTSKTDSSCSQELPKQKKNMYHMISLLLGQQQTVSSTPLSGGP